MTLADLQNVISKPAWSKDVVVWAGNAGPLASALEGIACLELDLLDLMHENGSSEKRADDLAAGLDEWLRTARQQQLGRVVLVVRNAALLARYRVGLRSFYDWFGGARTMVVLHVERVSPIVIPESTTESIRYDADRIVDYLRPLLAGPDRVFAEVS